MRFFTGLALAMCLCVPVLAAHAPDDPATRGPRPAVKVPFPPIKDFSTLRIRLERTACYGWCPAYSVEIAGDGTVTWYGKHYVEAQGERFGRIPVGKVRALYDAFAKADFFWTFDQYRAPITDLPIQILSISFDGHAKTITDYAGARAGMPKAIDDLEEAVDQAAGTKAWVGNTRQP